MPFLKKLYIPVSSACALLLTGCGQPPGSGGGPPEGDFPTSAVVAPAKAEEVDEEVTLVATLEARDEVTLVSEINSSVERIAFTEGDPVGEGDVLVALDDTQTKALLEEARAGFALAELTWERSKKLLETKTISQEAYDEAEANYYNRKAALALAEDNQAKTSIEAPFDGRVGERAVSVGQVVTPGTLLTNLSSMDALEAAADVPERYLRFLRVGMKATFEADAFPGERFPARVAFVAPTVDPTSRTIRIKAELQASGDPLRPGLFGRLSLVLEERDSSVLIPEAAIQFSGDDTSVVAVTDQGRSEFRSVKVGRRFKGEAEITEGLAQGELVVVEGHQKLGPDMLVMAAPESSQYGVTPGPLGAAPAAGEETVEAR